MSTSPLESPPAPTRTLCLGEARVELICERPIERLLEADSFVAHFGGAVANVAVVGARAGARVTLAGGAGADDWGRWLRNRLEDEGVDVSLFTLVEGRQTRMAVVTVGGDGGPPAYRIYGDAAATVAHALDGRLEEAVNDSAALFISSHTLVGAEEREVTMSARELMRSLERPVIFDANLVLDRWPSHAEAAASCNACVPGALLVRATAAEAALMTGEDDPERAALALLKAGAHMAVLTVAGGGAILRGEFRADVAGATVDVVSTIGAGEALTGTLLARLAVTGFYPAAVAAALPAAVEASARACEHWGGLE